MAATWRSAADTLVRDLERIFRGRLRSVVAYGARLEGADTEPLTCLALVDAVAMADLDECAKLAHHWSQHQIATPLLLPEQEFRRSLDAFPLEYGEIIRVHAQVYGADPFHGATISHEDLRRACETQVKGHLLHLREAYIESGGHLQAVADLVTASAPAFAALLRNVARLNGVTASDRTQATLEGAREATLPAGLVGDILALEQADRIPTADAARLFPDYLAAVEQLAARVDQWRT